MVDSSVLKKMYDLAEQLCQTCKDAGYSPDDSSSESSSEDSSEGGTEEAGDVGVDDGGNPPIDSNAGKSYTPPAKKKGSMLDTAMAMMKGA